MSEYTVLLSQQSRESKLIPYFNAIKNGATPGLYMRNSLQCEGTSIEALTLEEFYNILLNTKKPQIFAESAIVGDGSDWNQEELAILGDTSIAVPVTVFDNGRHENPKVHDNPFKATLLYVPGALLCNGRGFEPCDYSEVTSNGELCEKGYYELYERRLLPALLHANAVCEAANQSAFITMPGIGCGMFAGEFGGQLQSLLKNTVQQLLENHNHSLPRIRAVYLDLYNSGDNERHELDHISYLVRPLYIGSSQKNQLCEPNDYAEGTDDFSNSQLFSIVAWDHVSWPGNDYWVGSRATDDGVKAAATDTMKVMTGIVGEYDSQRCEYAPPKDYETWDEVVSKKGLKLST